MQETTTTSETTFIINMVLTAWEAQLERFQKFLDKTSDQHLEAQIAPGRNRGIYLLGHLTATNDSLFPLFGLGERLYPQLQDVFIRTPDRSVDAIPPTAELRKYWQDVNNKLIPALRSLSTEDWLSRHTAVSVEDFAKEPQRNKLNVLLNRTTHQGYHFGQVILL
jgi:hypothetical protein